MNGRVLYPVLAVGAVAFAAVALVRVLGGVGGMGDANLAALSLLVAVSGLAVFLPWYVTTAAEDGDRT